MKRAVPFMLITLMGISALHPYITTVKADDSSDDLRILFTNDLHDHVMPSPLVQEDNSVIQAGGYAHLKGAIDEERNDNSVLVDAGDFSTGTYFEGVYENDAPDLSLMGKMGYDAITLGERDFDYGVSSFEKMLSESTNTPTLVSSNINFGDSEEGRKLERTWENKKADSYKILEKAGIKVGIFGVLDNDTASDITSDMDGVTFDDSVRSARNAVKALQDEGADYIICLFHGGTDDEKTSTAAERLADKVRGINVIIDGHNHTATKKVITGDHDTAIVSSGSKGQYLGRLDVDADSKTVKDLKLIPVTDETASDTDIESSVKTYSDDAAKKVFTPYGLTPDTVVASNSYNFKPVTDDYNGFVGNSTGDLVADAFAYAYTDWYENWYDGWSEDREERLEKAEEADEKKQQKAADEMNQAIADAQAAGKPTPTPTPTPSTDPKVTAIRNEEPDVKEIAIGIATKQMINDTFYAGNITAADCFDVTGSGTGTDGTTGTSLVLVFLKGSDIRQLAEYDATVGRTKDPAEQLYFSGLKYDYSDYRRDWNHVEEVYVDAVQGYYVPVQNNSYYPVVMSLEVADQLQKIGQRSDGRLSVTFCDENGKKISNPKKAILSDDSGNEVKEYTALASYLQDLERNGDGTSVVPARYQSPREVKNIDRSFNLVRFFKNTSEIAWKEYRDLAIAIVVVIVGLHIVRKVFRWRIRRDN